MANTFEEYSTMGENIKPPVWSHCIRVGATSCPLPRHPSPIKYYSHGCSQTRAELLHKQNAQIKELRRKQRAEQLAVAGATSHADGMGDQEQEEGEDKDGSGSSGNEAEGGDGGGVVASLRKVRAPCMQCLASWFAGCLEPPL